MKTSDNGQAPGAQAAAVEGPEPDLLFRREAPGAHADAVGRTEHHAWYVDQRRAGGAKAEALGTAAASPMTQAQAWDAAYAWRLNTKGRRNAERILMIEPAAGPPGHPGLRAQGPVRAMAQAIAPFAPPKAQTYERSWQFDRTEEG